jgi:ribosomal protein L44E
VESKTQKDTQKLEEKNKVKGNKGSGGNTKRAYNKDEGRNKKKRKVKFPCNICGDDHLTDNAHKCKNPNA